MAKSVRKRKATIQRCYRKETDLESIESGIVIMLLTMKIVDLSEIRSLQQANIEVHPVPSILPSTSYLPYLVSKNYNENAKHGSVSEIVTHHREKKIIIRLKQRSRI